MAKHQTRRSISVRGATYDRLRDYCAATGLSLSDFVEQRIAEFFAAHPSALAFPRKPAGIEQSRHVVRPSDGSPAAKTAPQPAGFDSLPSASVARRLAVQRADVEGPARYQDLAGGLWDRLERRFVDNARSAGATPQQAHGFTLREVAAAVDMDYHSASPHLSRLRDLGHAENPRRGIWRATTKEGGPKPDSIAGRVLAFLRSAPQAHAAASPPAEKPASPERRVFGAMTPLDQRASADVAKVRPVRRVDPDELRRPPLSPGAGVRAAPRPAPEKVAALPPSRRAPQYDAQWDRR